MPTERTYQGVTRSVCIGLGGTGLQTIMRLRRLIVERYKSLDNFPIVRFVLIDTDSGSLDSAHLNGRTFHRGVDISLKAQEKVHIGMTATDADALRRALRDRENEFSDRSNLLEIDGLNKIETRISQLYGLVNNINRQITTTSKYIQENNKGSWFQNLIKSRDKK
jgi:hypothetical protein